MTSSPDTARASILADVRAALGRRDGEPMPRVPDAARAAARTPGSQDAEIDLLLAEIARLGGQAQRMSAGEISGGLAELVRREEIRKAMLWETPALQAWGVAEILAGLGVEIVPTSASKEVLAECDLGVTGADMALPETGTLVLRTGPARPRVASLLPRVHLALVQSAALRADLAIVLEELKGDRHFVFITGPSRTADIELVVTVGVHGPQVLAAWVVDG